MKCGRDADYLTGLQWCYSGKLRRMSNQTLTLVVLMQSDPKSVWMRELSGGNASIMVFIEQHAPLRFPERNEGTRE